MGLWITGFSCHLKASSAQHHLDHNTLSIHEAARSRRGKAKHSQWRNYDDLNEYFWSADCFRLGWPMRADADFFCLPVEELRAERNGVLWCCKLSHEMMNCALLIVYNVKNQDGNKIIGEPILDYIMKANCSLCNLETFLFASIRTDLLFLAVPFPRSWSLLPTKRL
ncbi:uncharacterized protein LOC107823059 isoform X1 [Nicotiana tabacum]|uniref:Uncharacterized protein LOC107823059 isoform X1 n=1 Tax=Nicotiana tabacum TaxID=4097 RepID=A0AC58S021_TOBAC